MEPPKSPKQEKKATRFSIHQEERSVQQEDQSILVSKSKSKKPMGRRGNDSRGMEKGMKIDGITRRRDGQINRQSHWEDFIGFRKQ